ncbi:MAG: hypothetical protein ACYTGP_09145 [Planctomycetota bacterium]|jgi:hypothetical protein
MNIKITAGVIVAALGIVMLAAQPGRSAPQDSREEDLVKQIEALRARLAKVEHAQGTPVHHASGMQTDEATTKPAVPKMPPGRPEVVHSMIVDSIQLSDHVEYNTAEIDRKRREVDALGSTLEQRQVHLKEEPEDADTYGWGYDGYYHRHGRNARDRAVISRRNVVNYYGTMHSIKQRELKAMQRANAEPKQIIVGHDGNVIITLHTKHNLQDQMDDISVNQRAAWSGHRIETGDGWESWVIYAIHPVDD